MSYSSFSEMSYFSLVSVVTWLCLHRGMNQQSLSLQMPLVQGSHTKLCIAAAEEPPVPKAAPVPWQHSPVYHWLWHRSSTASGKQGVEAQWFLALPPQQHTPAVRCPSASLESTYPASVLDPDFTHCPWRMSDHPYVATDTAACPACFLHALAAAPEARLFLEGCHRAATLPHTWAATHFSSYSVLQSWNCFQSPPKCLQAKQWLISQELLVWHIWRQGPSSKASTPHTALCFWEGLVQISQTLGINLTNVTSSSSSFSSCPPDASFCLNCPLNTCFYLLMLLSPATVMLI